jgi:hypothetical protein
VPVAAADASYEFRRRPGERVYAADVTSVHEVFGPAEQRCWVEHEHADASRAREIGGGTEREIQRCENVTNAAPDYWDVTYWFRGVEHHAQMTTPPGQTITVNGEGVPRQ